jgi:hypothetical protein
MMASAAAEAAAAAAAAESVVSATPVHPPAMNTATAESSPVAASASSAAAAAVQLQGAASRESIQECGDAIMRLRDWISTAPEPLRTFSTPSDQLFVLSAAFWKERGEGTTPREIDLVAKHLAAAPLSVLDFSASHSLVRVLLEVMHVYASHTSIVRNVAALVFTLMGRPKIAEDDAACHPQTRALALEHGAVEVCTKLLKFHLMDQRPDAAAATWSDDFMQMIVNVVGVLWLLARHSAAAELIHDEGNGTVFYFTVLGLHYRRSALLAQRVLALLRNLVYIEKVMLFTGKWQSGRAVETVISAMKVYGAPLSDDHVMLQRTACATIMNLARTPLNDTLIVRCPSWSSPLAGLTCACLCVP